jgi:hypothetical protein
MDSRPPLAVVRFVELLPLAQPSPWQLQEDTLLLAPSLWQAFPLLKQQCRADCPERANASFWMVLLAPENEVGWRARLDLIALGQLDLQEELRLNMLAALRGKKSSYPFFVRLKIYEKMEGTGADKYELERPYMQWYLGTHARNYHFWNFRLRLLELLN